MDILDMLDNKKPTVESFNGEFEPLIPFDNYETPDIPPSLLPDALAGFVQNISQMLCVPTAMPVMAALGMVSAAMSKKFVVKPFGDWREPVNIYTLIAMPPASNKSQVLKYLKAPIDEWEGMQETKIAPERKEALVNIKIIETEIAKALGVIRNKKSKAEDIDKSKTEMVTLDEKLQKLKEDMPVVPQIYTTDATPEAIAELVHEQKGRLAIISDEGGITEVLAGLYNNGNANIDIVLKGIDGGATRIKRANRDYKLNPYLTLALLIQPQILTNMADKKSFTGNGALERYLYALPIGNVGYRQFEEIEIDAFAQTQYSNAIINLLHLPIPDEPHCMTLDTPSFKMFKAFREKEIERELRPDGQLYICRAWAGKLAGYTLRIAALMHQAQHQSPQHTVIQEATMLQAIALSRLLMKHAIAAFSMMGADTEVNDAKELLEWLKAIGKDRLTKTEIIDGNRNKKLGEKKRLGNALALLISKNYLSEPHSDASTRKPTEVYFVNSEIKLNSIRI
ncbi:MAG: YfjI family protein [Alphaproteobacteria bacterium]